MISDISKLYQAIEYINTYRSTKGFHAGKVWPPSTALRTGDMKERGQPSSFCETELSSLEVL